MKITSMTTFFHWLRLATALALAGWQSNAQANVFKCSVNDTTTYQAQPCPGGREMNARPTSVPPTTTPTPKSSDRGDFGVSLGRKKGTCVGEELSLNFQSTPLRMVLQVIADFSGRRAEIDPSISEAVPINYSCTPWRQVLQDVAEKHRLSIRIEDKRVLVSRR